MTSYRLHSSHGQVYEGAFSGKLSPEISFTKFHEPRLTSKGINLVKENDPPTLHSHQKLWTFEIGLKELRIVAITSFIYKEF